MPLFAFLLFTSCAGQEKNTDTARDSVIPPDTGGDFAVDSGNTDGCLLLEGNLSYEFMENFRYGDVGAEQHRMDVLVPEGEGPFPAMVYMHGGGWKAGNKESMRNMAARYAQSGVAGLSIGYRLSSPGNPSFPGVVQDVACAIRSIKEHAGNLNIDPDRIGVMGTSAGGHLSALIGALDPASGLGDSPCATGDSDHSVALVVDYFGPTDLPLLSEDPGTAQTTEQFLGASLESDPQLWAQASPVSHVDSADPPFVIVHGSLDQSVPPVHSERLHSVLQDAGVESTLMIIDGAEHSFHREEEFNDQARCVIDPAVRRHLLE